MARHAFQGWILFLALVPPLAADPVGTDALDFRYLPQLRRGWARLASSSDPAGGNDDRGHYQRLDGATAVLLDAQGPGMLTRIWSANPQGMLAIYFDGEPQPRVHLPFDQLATETASTPTVANFVSRAGGGVSCWFPMPYAKRIKVAVEGAEQLYYQVDYTTWPDDAHVTTFAPGPYQPPSGMDWGQPTTTQATIPPGAARTLFDLPGPATVRRLVLTVQPVSYDALRPLVLRMRWDGAAPSVDVPLLDFFASGLGAAQFLSAPMAVAEWGFFTLDFPLPYQTRGSAELVNRGSAPVTVESNAYVTAGRRADDGYFHAQYHAATTVAGQPHRVVEVHGAGLYVGTAAALSGDSDLKYLEGDDQIQVDDKLKLFGTGTEDYFSGAWYFRHGPFSDVFAGAPLLAGGKSRLAAFRWHIGDCIPFKQHLVVNLEHGGRNDAPGCLYRTVAYWYGATPQAVPAATPPGRPAAFTAAEPGSVLVEGESLAGQAKGEAVEVAAVDDHDTPLPASGGKLLRVRFTSPKGGSVGLPCEVTESGYYEVALHLAAGGPTFQVTADLDGQPLPPPVVQATLGDPNLVLGRTRTEAGKHVLTVTAKPFGGGRAGGMLGLDYVTFRPIGKMKGVLEAESLATKVSGKEAAVVVQTDRNLPAKPVRSAQLVGGAVPTEALWSGGAQVRFTPGAAGDCLDLTVPVKEAGDYGMAASFSRGPDYGACEVLLDGKWSCTVSNAQTTDEIGGRVPLGTHRLSAGEHHLVLRSVPTPGKPGEVRGIGLDYVVLAPSNGAQEAEFMRGPAGAVTKLRFGAEPRWSGGGFVRVPAGSLPRFLIEAPRAGRYKVTIKEVRIPGGGQFHVILEGRLEGAIDCGGNSEAVGQGLTFTARLRRDGSALEFLGPSGDLAFDVVTVEYLGRGVPWGWLGGGIAILVVLLALAARRKKVQS